MRTHRTSRSLLVFGVGIATLLPLTTKADEHCGIGYRRDGNVQACVPSSRTVLVLYVLLPDGRLATEAADGLELRLDGRVVPYPDSSILEVRPGRRRLDVRAPGFVPIHRSIRVQRATDVELELVLVPEPASTRAAPTAARPSSSAPPSPPARMADLLPARFGPARPEDRDPVDRVRVDGATVHLRDESTIRPLTVTVPTFWIDRTEVTEHAYARCVAAGRCERTRRSADAESPTSTLPVSFVRWFDAFAYCDFAGGRLPTEAEWELAARGETLRRFPWGEHPVDESRAAWSGACGSLGCRSDLAAVGSHPAGATPNGIVDLAGNVAEWVADGYVPYAELLAQTRTYSIHETARVVRGGDVGSHLAWWLSTTARTSVAAEDARSTIGFRCAADEATR